MASISFPRSCKWLGEITFEKDPRPESKTASAITNAMADRAWPPDEENAEDG